VLKEMWGTDAVYMSSKRAIPEFIPRAKRKTTASKSESGNTATSVLNG
jgi:hypothetical protein